MQNMKTRKGLAVATAAGFVAAVFTGVAPASANETLTLGPASGSGNTTISGSTFTLEAGIPATTPSTSIPFLSFRVENPSLNTLAAADILADTTGGAEQRFAYGTETSEGLDDNDFVLLPDNRTANNTHTPTIGKTSFLELRAAHTDAYSVTVTAWLDVNGNETIDAGEDRSPATTVTWINASDVVGTVSMVAPLVNDDTLNANVTFSNADLNVRQIDDGDVLVQFGEVSGSTFTRIESFADTTDGTGNTTANTTVTTKTAVTSNPVGNSVSWDSVNGVFEAEFTPLATERGTTSSTLAVAAGTVYGAKLFLDNDNNDSADVTDASDQEGAISTVTTAASATAYSVAFGVVEGSNASNTDKGFEDPNANATGYTDDQDNVAIVRAGSSNSAESFTYEVFVGTDVTVPVGVKSVPVKATFANGTGLTLADGVTVDGLSVYSGKSRSITKNTDATGKVTFEVVGAKAEATDRLDITLSVNGVAPGAQGANTSSADAEVTWTAANYDIHVKNDLAAEGGISIASGGTFTVDYEVYDQFGEAPANNLYRVIAQDKSGTNAGRSTAADFAFDAPVVDGLASVEITDDGVGTGSYTLEAGYAVISAAISTSDNDSVDLTVQVVDDATPATITLDDLAYGTEQLEDANTDGDYTDSGDTDNRDALLLETKSLFTYIANTAGPEDSAPEVRDSYKVTVAGTITNAAGAAVPYAPVTMSASKFLFKASSTNFVMDEISLYADSTGDFSVDLFSESSGSNVISITSGGATESATLVYAGAASGAADDFTITTPGASEPGRTVDVAIRVIDDNGNGVQGASVTLSSTGPGYLINTSGTTLADGTFNTKVLLGVNDSGTAVVKATMTIDSKEVSKTSSIVVGVGAVAEADKKVNAGSFKGYVAVYAKGYEGQRLSAKIGNDWVIVPALASSFERVVDLTGAGVDIAVRIYIDRVLQDTINLTTK